MPFALPDVIIRTILLFATPAELKRYEHDTCFRRIINSPELWSMKAHYDPDVDYCIFGRLRTTKTSRDAYFHVLSDALILQGKYFEVGCLGYLPVIKELVHQGKFLRQLYTGFLIEYGDEQFEKLHAEISSRNVESFNELQSQVSSNEIRFYKYLHLGDRKSILEYLNSFGEEDNITDLIETARQDFGWITEYYFTTEMIDNAIELGIDTPIKVFEHLYKRDIIIADEKLSQTKHLIRHFLSKYRSRIFETHMDDAIEHLNIYYSVETVNSFEELFKTFR